MISRGLFHPLPCLDSVIVISGGWFINSWSKGVLDIREVSTAGNPCCWDSHCQCHTPATVQGRRQGRRELSITLHMDLVLQYSNSTWASMRTPTWSHLEAWQLQFLAGWQPLGYHGATVRTTSAFTDKKSPCHFTGAVALYHIHRSLIKASFITESLLRPT